MAVRSFTAALDLDAATLAAHLTRAASSGA